MVTEKRSLWLLLYAIGISASSSATSPEAHQLLNILIGFGIAGSGFGPVLAVVGRSTSNTNRSLALGITTEEIFGSAGQVVGPPLVYFIVGNALSTVFEIFAIITLLTIILVPILKTNKNVSDKKSNNNLKDALKEAIKDPTFIMLFFGFFSCGFQLAFITAHFLQLL